MTSPQDLRAFIEALPNDKLDYGVKGMKWGRRKRPVPTSSGRSNGPKKIDVKSLSDAQLRDAINRMNMEKQYASMTAGRKEKGKQLIKEMLVTAGKQQAQQLVNQGAAKVTKVAMSAILKEAAKVAAKRAARALVTP